jgi:hypothetical protein
LSDFRIGLLQSAETEKIEHTAVRANDAGQDEQEFAVGVPRKTACLDALSPGFASFPVACY